MPLQPAASEIQPLPQERFRIVGIGASAGGLEAFSALLEALPEDTGMAYVLIQHLDPHHESHLGDLLSKITHLPIQEATQNLSVSPNHVYVIPPNVSITIHAGVLQLMPREQAGIPFLPIDQFFRALADDLKDRAIGVILSGSGTDGTQGMMAIKAAGGITFAEAHASARYPAMPDNAIRSGCVDFILPPAAISEELCRIIRRPILKPVDALMPEPFAITSSDYQSIIRILKATIGVDFDAYRDTTIKRRIRRRMMLHTKNKVADYIQILEQDQAEVKDLYNDLLINVTQFFRNPEAFETLKTSVFPQILKRKEVSQPIRIWVPGCSSGQEAYSLAIVLLEFLRDKTTHSDIQIFATDLSDEMSLQKAREGLYPASIANEVSSERLQRFFTKENGMCRISKTIRDMCVFAKHDVAADPPFSRMDLISCRNLLIYMAQPLQWRVIPTFHYALNPGGFLLLGASETAGAFADLFDLVNQQQRIYVKKAVRLQNYPHFTTRTFQSNTLAVAGGALRTVTATDWQQEAERIILKKYAPAGVLVNDNLDILQFYGKTSLYLESPPGGPNYNLLRMACEGLFPSLHNTIEESRAQKVAISRMGLRIQKDTGLLVCNIHVTPVSLSGSSENCFLVLFDQTVTGTQSVVPKHDLSDAGEADNLRKELVSLNQYLQSVVTQKDSMNEELRAINEESLSSNEELQSTNEELETAKEELQSINEELMTVNDQMCFRNKELSHLNEQLQDARDYAKAIVETVRGPLVVLNADLRVQMANVAFYKMFHVRVDETENRLLADLGNRQWDIPDLVQQLLDILPRETRLSNFEVRHTFEKIGFKIMLLNARSIVHHYGKTPLVLLAIEDISEQKWLEEELRKSTQKLAEADQRKDEFLATLAHELRNPLAPLRNALEILRLPDTDSGMRTQAQAIMDEQLRYMVRLVDDLLDVSRITSGKIELRMDRVELSQIIRSAIESSTPLITAAGHELTVTLPEEPLWLNGDPTRLVQIFGNIINNSAKYTKNDGHIQITADRLQNDICVAVKDNGIGLAANMLPRVFKMFSQIDAAIEHAQGGMGIGLALVKKLVELHGGSVTASSPGIGLGSEFMVRLPAALPPEHRTAALSETASGAPRNAKIRRILVVDDNENSARTMEWMLQLMFGHDTRCAHNGIDTIAIAKGFLPDLILLDIGLPGMNGYDVCHVLQQEPALKKTMIVAMTGWGQHEDHQRSRRAGFHAHLVKPVDIDALKKVLTDLDGRESPGEGV
jgi:two-component system CheB/CheR fusion protein